MARTHLVVGIDWYGPFTLQEARRAASAYHEGGLYLCTGKVAGAKTLRIQYVGKSNKRLFTRISDAHHKLKLVKRNRHIWLGEVATGNVPGKKKVATPETLRMAEWATARFLQLPLNDKLRNSLPKRPVTVLNRWWKVDYETPRLQRPHSEWPDLIDFLGEEYRARNVWFGSPGRQTTFPQSSFNS